MHGIFGMFGFGIYTSVLSLFPLGCLVLFILQLIVNYYYTDSSDFTPSKYSKSLLYIIYTTGMACGVIGFSLHASSTPEWCMKYGFLPCFAFLGLSKASLYVFFLRRAESAQGIKLTRFKRIIFRYVAPIYLLFYWIVYCTLTTYVFAGKIVRDEISYCVFAKGAWWFSVFAACVDMFNALGSLALFIHPLAAAMAQAGLTKLQTGTDEYRDYVSYVSIMKWNIVLTSIAAASSVISLFCFYIVQEYVWFFCLGDPFINALCTFLMVGPNRKFMKRICCQKKQVFGADAETPQDVNPYVVETHHEDNVPKMDII